jgi:tetratricopeptide (TPR) repeat protein
MVEELVPTTLPESIREVVIARAEGNPFFVEEVLRTLIDQGVLRRNGGWTVGEVPPDLAVPDTVQAVLAARIDLLAPAEKAALQAAAVIGRTFWSGPVYELVGALEPDLRLLEERDFIRHRPSSSISGEREFVIKHALTREVAYESLPKAKRAHLHAQFAKWLERASEGRRDEQAAMLAHHYAAAADPAQADLAWTGAEAELAPVRERAVFWLRRAAELAVGRYEIDDAIALLERAAALEPDRAAQVEIWREIGHANALYYNAGGFSAAMKHAIELAGDEPDATELYSELAFQSVIRLGMWGVAPDVRLVEGWTAQALERAPASSTARAKALIARCYSDYDKSSELVAEACEVSEQLGETSLRSYAYDVQAVMAFAAGEHEESSQWCDRRLALVDEITDPDHKADIYANAIAPAVARGRFEDAQHYALLHGDVTSGLSPHHRLHGVSALLELQELRGDWDGAVELERPIEDAVADNAATPCVRNPRSLLVCAIAHAYRGEESEARRLEDRAQEQSMTGYGTVLDTPRIQLALHRGDLDAVASLLGEPAVRRTNWFYLSSMATHLDALAALRDRERVECEANSVLRPNTYLEPFGLRALGIVREDQALIERAAATFAALGLAWHAETTRALV